MGVSPPSLNQAELLATKQLSTLILYIAAKIKEVFKLGRRYPWPRPEICPGCRQSGLWGHGYVSAYFDGFDEGIFLKRYRCPGCGCVIRLRPKGYLSRFQAPLDAIRLSLSCHLKYGRWPPGLSRSRQGHWLRALRRKILAYLGQSWKESFLEAFDHLIARGINPVSRSF